MHVSALRMGLRRRRRPPHPRARHPNARPAALTLGTALLAVVAGALLVLAGCATPSAAPPTHAPADGGSAH